MNNEWKGLSKWLIKAMNYASYYKTERGVKREGERLTNFWLWKGHPLQPHHICTASELASCLEGAHSLGCLLPSITHLTILTSGNKGSSMGQLVCLHMQPLMGRGGQLQAVGGRGYKGHARPSVGAPSTPAAAESQ